MATGNSAEGKACAKLPPTVPRLRIWIWPMNAAASRSSGQRLATSGERSSSRWPDESKIHQRHETLTAGKRSRLIAELRHQAQRFINRGRIVVIEFCRFHT